MAFDIPYPADYGGVIDVFYKIKALAEMQVQVHLHCYYHRRAQQPELERYCASVQYYKRHMGWWNHLHVLPFTVCSRPIKALRKNLLQDQYPIIAEVLHTIRIFKDPAFQNRLKIYRHSNIEHTYYRALARAEGQLLKKMYLYLESVKLFYFESYVKYANQVWAVNSLDAALLTSRYPQTTIHYLPSFNGHVAPNLKPGKGNYILFHGNLDVSENIMALTWIINALQRLNIKLIVAGKCNSASLQHTLQQYAWVQLIPSPNFETLHNLICNAHIHVLYTHQNTGLKLKLLEVLFNGRFVVCNTLMLSGTPFNVKAVSGLHVADAPEDFAKCVNDLMQTEYKPDVNNRSEILQAFTDANTVNQALAFLNY